MNVEPIARPPPLHDASVEQIRVELALARARTRASFQELQAELREEVAAWTDWGAAFQARPGLFVGAAFALGFFVGVQNQTRFR